VTSLGAPSTLRADSRPDELELPNAARYLTILGIIGSYFMWTLPLGSWNINGKNGRATSDVFRKGLDGTPANRVSR
jgi:hypothetical protein